MAAGKDEVYKAMAFLAAMALFSLIGYNIQSVTEKETTLERSLLFQEGQHNMTEHEYIEKLFSGLRSSGGTKKKILGVPLRSTSPSRYLTSAPTPLVSSSPSPSFEFEERIFPYTPGLLNKYQNGLILSSGLSSKLIARSRKRISYSNGESSSRVFQMYPDAAAVFPTKAGGWVYVSNSEVGNGGGGVGAITFNSNGVPIDYKMILNNTNLNCGGGRTPWGSWVSCEEYGNETVGFLGQCWQTDPLGERKSVMTSMGGSGGKFESMAYDNRNSSQPRFFVTEDRTSGEIRRFTPFSNVTKSVQTSGDYWPMLTEPGIIDYLVLIPSDDDNNHTTGNFTWSTSIRKGETSAKKYFQNCEGIAVADETLFFVSKKQKELFILDLDAGTYQKTSTVHGSMDGSPDQIKLIVGSNDGLMYFTEEDGKAAGVHARDLNGNVLTILEGPHYSKETTGLAFSPDMKHLYVAFQTDGLLFDIYRQDGLPFGGKSFDATYHASEPQ